MPYVDPTTFPADIPEGAWHLDADDVEDFRLPRTLDTDFLLFQEARTDGTLVWKIRENSRVAAHTPSTTQLAAAASFAKDRTIRTLQAQLAASQAQAAQAPAPAGVPGAARPQTVRLPLPRAFMGVPTKEGVYDPSPRDFTLSISQYMHNQQQELNEVFTDERKMRLFAGFLDQAASRWYSSLVNEREQAAQRAQPYQGPLSSMDTLADKFLREFEDVNICDTDKNKVKTLVKGRK